MTRTLLYPALFGAEAHRPPHLPGQFGHDLIVHRDQLVDESSGTRPFAQWSARPGVLRAAFARYRRLDLGAAATGRSA